jgi:hypothetical protein
MNNAAAILRSVITYAVCVVLAVFVGYQLKDPLTVSTFSAVGFLILLLVSPLLLRWHHLLLLLSWNVVAVLFFVTGKPPMWLAMVALSLSISILQRALNREVRFVNVPQVTRPLAFLLVVTLVTAYLTGGIGIRAFGSDVFGGRRYVYLIGAILGYFALTAQRIPQERAGLYFAVFFLGGLTSLIGDLIPLVTPSFYFIFWLFPPSAITGQLELGTTRLGGIAGASFAVYYYMLSRYGIRGIFSLNKPWRIIVFIAFVPVGLLGGYRLIIIIIGMTFVVQFFLEGLHRTKMFPGMVLAAVLAAAILVPVAPKLPYTFQRALAFLPLQIDPLARQDAEGSSEWRLKMWTAILPEVPKYLWLGKGYALSAFDFDFMKTRQEGNISAENWDAAVAGDYHNGPLSVVLTFGIWGVIGFLWFVASSLRVLYCNYRYGPPPLKTFNTLLFASFVTRLVMFFLVFGSFYSDMFQFAGLLGLSVSLNGGVCRPSPSNVPETQKTEGVAGMLPRPAFQRS